MTVDAQEEWFGRLTDAGHYQRWIVSVLRPYLAGQVLEVGCGVGANSPLIAKLVESVTAVELDPAFAATAAARLAACPNVTVLQGDALAMPREGAFDTVVMLDVLEHIQDDAGTLRALAGHLRPGGCLVVKVPALQSLFGPMDEAVGHFRRYGRRGLADTFVAAGLPRPEIKAFNAAGVFGWWWHSRMTRRAVPGEGSVKSFDALVPLFRRLEAAVEPPVGLSYFAAARLPAA